MSNLTRKEKEKISKRNDIIKAAISVFAEKGFDNATLDEIAEKAEFSKGTIYNYFENKTDLYISIIKEIYEKEGMYVEKLLDEASSMEELLIKHTKKILEFTKDNSETFFFMARIHTNLSEREMVHSDKDILKVIESKRNKFLKFYDDCVKNGEIRDIDFEFFTTIYQGFLYTYIHKTNIVNKKRYNAKKEAEKIVDLILNGLKKK